MTTVSRLLSASFLLSLASLFVIAAIPLEEGELDSPYGEAMDVYFQNADRVTSREQREFVDNLVNKSEKWIDDEFARRVEEHRSGKPSEQLRTRGDRFSIIVGVLWFVATIGVWKWVRTEKIPSIMELSVLVFPFALSTIQLFSLHMLISIVVGSFLSRVLVTLLALSKEREILN